MNRNAAIGVILVAVLLASISVGIATYMSSGDIEASTKELRADLDASASEMDAKIADVSTTANDALPRENGEAVALAATDTLWSKGRLVVSEGSASQALFDVDPSLNQVVVDAPLTVTQLSTMGDVDAGALNSTGVSGDVLQTTSGSWQVSAAGAVKQDGDLIIGGNEEVDGSLLVRGDSLTVGDSFVFDRTFDPKGNSELESYRNKPVLSVVGTVIASEFRTTAQYYDFFQGLKLHQGYIIANTAYGVNSAGAGTFASVSASKVTANVVNDSSKNWWVASNGAGGFDSLTDAGTSDGAVDWSISASGVGSLRGLNDASKNWWVASNGAGGFDSLTDAGTSDGAVDWSVTGAGVGSLKSLNAGGTEVGSSGVEAHDKNVKGSDLVARNSFMIENGNFSVDDSGSVNMAGDLDVTGKIGGGGLIEAVTGFEVSDAAGYVDAYQGRFNNVLIDGVALDPGVGSDLGKDVSGRDIVASRSFSLENGNFAVDSAGDVAMAGTLTVADLDVTNDATVGRDATIGRDLDVAADAAIGGGLIVDANAAIAGDLDVAGSVTASNLPAGMASGTAAVGAGATVNVAVAGMPGGAVAVVTPQTAASGDGFPFSVSTSAGTVSITNDGPAATFNWIATW